MSFFKSKNKFGARRAAAECEWHLAVLELDAH